MMPEALTPSLQDAIALGLTQPEYQLICEKQGAPPNVLELAMYSLMWSEHCAYKHSKRLLSTLPSTGGRLVLGPGENAGAVDIGDGLVCAFKVESHNHPSAIEPFEGAATGVGGILRDIFALGARPIAVLDSLRFGEPDARRTRYLLDGAVAGIAHYGNCVGVPNVGGEVYFEDAYSESCLINVMALGIAPREQLLTSAARGPGNLLMLFGASTGRDGIGGASVLASAELGEQDSGKRPTVQVGDPFAGKKLLECSLELRDRGLLTSLQDLGAAGLTSAAAEMASKGGVGLDINVSKVPLREDGMEPFEVMVSESQERMLCVIAPEHAGEVRAVCEKWEVACAAIGCVTAGQSLRVSAGQQLLAEMPVKALVDECPLYELEPARAATPLYPAPPARLAQDTPPSQTLLALLSSPNIAARTPLFEHYDCIVQSRTARRPGAADAAVLAIEPLAGQAGAADAEPGRIAGLGVSIDCNGRRVAVDPRAGTIAAVLECASNLACVGAQPYGLTNNLNFGNPEKPHIAWQLVESVRGLREACEALCLPVVGGNVSLYNESASGPIYPTPVIGMVGGIEDVRAAPGLGFAAAGEKIALAGPFAPALAAGELCKLRGLPLPQTLPELDLDAIVAAIDAVREAVRAGTLASAHDIAEGGLAVALAECCIAGGVGAEVRLTAEGLGSGRHEGAAGTSEGAAAGRAAPAEAAGPASVAEAAGPASVAEAPPPRARRAHAGEAPYAHTSEALEEMLFGECAGAFVLSGSEEALLALRARTQVRIVGTVGGESLRLDLAADGAREARVEVTLGELAGAHDALRPLFP